LFLDANDLAGPLPELFGAAWPLLTHLALGGNRMLQYIPSPPFGLDSWKLLVWPVFLVCVLLSVISCAV
jgi:hypothetical protein